MKRIIGQINPKDRHVTIWGAGFAGLVLGYYLKSNGYRITIYERSNKVGGKIHTKKTPFGPVETGPNALFLNADGLDLIRELKLEPLPATKKLRRLLMINGKPRRIFQFNIFSKIAINGRIKPPLISDGLTVAEFFRPLLGTEIINRYLSTALSGVYAVPAENLHFKSIFHTLAHKAQFDSYWEFIRTLLKEKKSQPKLDLSGSVSFEGGMQALINRLAEVLKSDIKLNYKEAFRVKGNTIVCTDAFNGSELISEIRPDLAAELKRIKYQQLTSVTVFMKREIRSLARSFGVLIPFNTGFSSNGVLNNKAIFPANNPNVLTYTFIGPKDMSEADLYNDIKLLHPEFVPEDIELMESFHWPKAVPIYDLQRYLSVKKMHQLAKKEENLAIFGNFVAGISLREMISAARSFAKNPTDYSEFK